MTRKEIFKQIDENNEVFVNADAATKRVMIASDALLWLDSGVFLATRGTIGDFKFQDYAEESSIKKLFENECIQYCECCAKGAMFMSLTSRVNEFDIRDFEDETGHHSAEMQRLIEYFSERQLAYIEWAFEGNLHIRESLNGEEFDFTEEEEDALDLFWKDYPVYNVTSTAKASDARLRAILYNIVENNGEFILTDYLT